MDPQFVDIDIKVDSRRSSFSVPGIVDVQIENFKDPVTEEDQHTKIQLPKGFIWNVAEASRPKS